MSFIWSNISFNLSNAANSGALRSSPPFFITLLSLFDLSPKAFAALSPACFNILPKSSFPDDTVRRIEWSGCGASCNDITPPPSSTPIFLCASSIITSNRLCIFSVSFLKKSSSVILLYSRSSSYNRH